LPYQSHTGSIPKPYARESLKALIKLEKPKKLERTVQDAAEFFPTG
jgi:hypothetical protein